MIIKIEEIILFIFAEGNIFPAAFPVKPAVKEKGIVSPLPEYLQVLEITHEGKGMPVNEYYSLVGVALADIKSVKFVPLR